MHCIAQSGAGCVLCSRAVNLVVKDGCREQHDAGHDIAGNDVKHVARIVAHKSCHACSMHSHVRSACTHINTSK